MKQLNLYYINSGSSVPEGRTALPTDDVSIWQRCGETGTTYTSLAQILADVATLIALMSSENACDYLVRSTTWTSAITTSIDAMKAIGASDYCSTTLISDNTWNTAIQNSTYFEYVDNAQNPVMTSDNTPEGQVVYSSQWNDGVHSMWKAFRGLKEDVESVFNSSSGNWAGYIFTTPFRLLKVEAYHKLDDIRTPVAGATIQTTSDGSTWGTAIYTFANKLYPMQTALVDEANVLGVRLNNLHSSDDTGLNYVKFYGRQTGGVQTWLRSAGITNKTYTTLAEVLADSTTLNALMASNDAVDYLVTAKGWALTICADSGAMTAIGQNNYCADTLLADSTWCNAICNSTYKDSVVNWKNPKMTSNTTPSGEAFLSKKYSDSFAAWMAFDYNDTTMAIVLAEPNNATGTAYIGYEATSQFVLKMVKILNYGAELVAGAHTVYVQGSNDGVTWENITSDTFTQTAGVWENIIIPTNDTKYSYHRVYGEPLNYGSGNYHFSFKEVQFYGREDV